MILLDSNTIIYLSKELILVDAIFDDNEEYGVSVITYMEVLGYDFESTKEKEFIEELFSYLHIIYIDETIANKVIEIKQENKMKLPDAIICATAIVNNSLLITNDIRLKNIKNLNVKIMGN
jgi:predicted nucleic acid-binding protein